MNTDSLWSKQDACFAPATRVGSVSITTPVSLLANEFDVGRGLHGQVSFAAVNQICVIHEAMKGCKKSKDSLKACVRNHTHRFYVYLILAFDSKFIPGI